MNTNKKNYCSKFKPTIHITGYPMTLREYTQYSHSEPASTISNFKVTDADQDGYLIELKGWSASLASSEWFCPIKWVTKAYFEFTYKECEDEDVFEQYTVTAVLMRLGHTLLLEFLVGALSHDDAKALVRSHYAGKRNADIEVRVSTQTGWTIAHRGVLSERVDNCNQLSAWRNTDTDSDNAVTTTVKAITVPDLIPTADVALYKFTVLARSNDEHNLSYQDFTVIAPTLTDATNCVNDTTAFTTVRLCMIALTEEPTLPCGIVGFRPVSVDAAVLLVPMDVNDFVDASKQFIVKAISTNVDILLVEEFLVGAKDVEDARVVFTNYWANKGRLGNLNVVSIVDTGHITADRKVNGVKLLNQKSLND